MDKAPSGDVHTDSHETQGLFSNMPLDNEFDVDMNLDTLFDILEEQPMNTNIIPNSSIDNVAPNHQNCDISELPNDLIVATNIIPRSSSTEKGDKNSSSRTTYQITLDDDDYSLYHVYAMGVKHASMLQEKGGTSKISTNDEKGQENSKNNDLISIPILMEKEGDIHISSRREQENTRSNVMVLQQSIPKLERELMKSKFAIDHPLGIPISTRKEQENSKANDLIHDPFMRRISGLEKLKRDIMKPRFTIDHTRREQENPRNNVIILDPPMIESPILMEKESDIMKSKHTVGVSTSRMGEKENHHTNGLIIQQYMSNILTLEKLKRNFVKPKLMPGHSFETPTRKREEKYKWEIDSGGFKSASSSNKEDEIRYGILNSLNNDQFSQKISSNGGPIRRSPNKTSLRYQPFETRTPNKQGSERHILKFSRVGETEKQNSNNEEALIGGRSLKPIIHSNRNFQGSPANTHEIIDKELLVILPAPPIIDIRS
ncbi:hypothetical protein RND71_002202 [Anisodus tanguticus]|uniref:Uncharacterized protein n=1 Tax=Anisodus tanguticus TaxID=243964 RepID=A0AAE1T1H8_9SOLA|nr:hypothetical protein RND71_002202 [Anisodus tanguticus]